MNKLLTVCKRISNNCFIQKSKHCTCIKNGNNSMMQQLFRNDNEDQNMKNLRPFRVSIEGNLGSGKSSVLQYFSTNPAVKIYPEPIEWWCNLEGFNLLDLLYKDMKCWYNVFQQYVQLTRVQVQTSPPQYSTTVQLFERSVQNNRYCFLEQAFAAGYVKQPEYDVLVEWYQWFEANIDIEIDFIVYLRTTPGIAFERISKRARKEETTVPLQYIESLHHSHEKWLFGENSKINPDNVLVIDADKPLSDVLAQCELHKDKILRYVLVERKQKQ